MSILSNKNQGNHRELNLILRINFNRISYSKYLEIESKLVTLVKTMGSVMTSVIADMIPKISRTFFQIAQVESLSGFIKRIHFIRSSNFYLLVRTILFFTLIMNLSCIGLIFDISYFCHDLLKFRFNKWSKMTTLYRTVNLCFFKWYFHALIIYL